MNDIINDENKKEPLDTDKLILVYPDDKKPMHTLIARMDTTCGTTQDAFAMVFIRKKKKQEND